MSISELVMVRVGHAVAALCLLFVLPILPFVAVAAIVSYGERPEPSYRPDWAESGG